MHQLLEIRNLSVHYGKIVALENASMRIHENDFIGVIGPNGGGKTTLLKSILGLITPNKGEIIFSEYLEEGQGQIGYLPQFNKFDNRFPINVSEVILSGIMGKNKQTRLNGPSNRARVKEVLEQLNIAHLSRKPIGELSGGQMQRVFLGRALVAKPKLLILDEPDTYVDNQFEHELYKILKELNHSMAILLVSHDVGTISAHVKSIACINRNLHYHPSNIISPKQLAAYNCPIQIITHGDVPHTVLGTHDHEHAHNHTHEHQHKEQ